MPMISVIVPVYRAEPYLRATLDALCGQTWRDLELILVDDGSPDACGQICDAYAARDARITVIHQPNAGVSAARNAGLALAQGEFIGFCDADDLPDPDLFATLHRLITAHSTDIAICQSVIVTPGGRRYTNARGRGEAVWRRREDFLREFLRGRFGVSVYTMLFRAGLARRIRFAEGRRINEDKMFVFDALMQADSVCCLDESKYQYLRRENSSSLCPFSAKFFDILYFAEQIDRAVAEAYPQLRGEALAGVADAHLQLLKIMLLKDGMTGYAAERAASIRYLRGLDPAFCRAYLPRANYIKWLSLKAGMPVFTLMIRLFSHV